MNRRRPIFGKSSEDMQAGKGKCEANLHTWMGDNPHSTFEQMHPAANKVEPLGFANPSEAGAKQASEDVVDKQMPKSGVYT